MAEAEDQQNFVANNGDEVPEHGLDEVHNGLQYQVHDETLGHQPYQVQDPVLEPEQYEVQDPGFEPQEFAGQLEYNDFHVQEDQVSEEVQDQPRDELQYQPQDQEEYQLQDQAEYQVEGEAGDQDGDEVQGEGEGEGEEGVPERVEDLEKSEPEGDATAGGEEKRWPGWPGETVFRMLVPAQKVGSIIGRKGDVIKKIVEETRARIKILDGPPGTTERAVMVSGKEEPESSLPPSMDGLLRVHMRIVDGLDGEASQAPPPTKVSTRLLVPASQAGSLIGKQGATVKAIQEAAGCIVRVLGSEDLPVFALQDDRVVEVVGEPTSVHKSLELIASHLRKFLVDRSIIPYFESQMQKPTRQMDHMPPPHQAWGPPQGHPPSGGGGPGYGHNPPPYMQQQPPRHDSYYPPPEMRQPPMEKQPHQGISAYGREPPMNVHVSAAPPMAAQQVTQQLQIQLSYADAVIGTSGSNISYTRRLSGATVTIQETRGVPGEMTVEVSGTGSQVQTAIQLIQNFMAEAGAPAPAQPQTVVAPEQQGYNPYATHGSVYAAAPPNPPGGYATDYSSGYGY
ncbi:unnamed protein product [Brassica rapa subsp. trilocularis]